MTNVERRMNAFPDPWYRKKSSIDNNIDMTIIQDKTIPTNLGRGGMRCVISIVLISIFVSTGGHGMSILGAGCRGILISG